jgi:hypothetical protein
MGILYGRAGCLTAENAGFRPGQKKAEKDDYRALAMQLYNTVRARGGHTPRTEYIP